MNFTVVILCMGAVSVFFSFWAFYKFYRLPRRMGRAISFMFLSEAVAIVVTLIFASLAYTGAITLLDGSVQNILRFILFGSAMASSIHLYYSVMIVNEKKEDKEDGKKEVK